MSLSMVLKPQFGQKRSLSARIGENKPVTSSVCLIARRSYARGPFLAPEERVRDIIVKSLRCSSGSILIG